MHQVGAISLLSRASGRNARDRRICIIIIIIKVDDDASRSYAISTVVVAGCQQKFSARLETIRIHSRDERTRGDYRKETAKGNNNKHSNFERQQQHYINNNNNHRRGKFAVPIICTIIPTAAHGAEWQTSRAPDDDRHDRAYTHRSTKTRL